MSQTHEIEHDGIYAVAERYSAEHIANDIMQNCCKNFDYTDWNSLTDAHRAEAFDEIVTMFATFENDKSLSLADNRSIFYIDLQNSIESTIKHWAQREINKISYNGLTKS